MLALVDYFGGPTHAHIVEILLYLAHRASEKDSSLRNEIAVLRVINAHEAHTLCGIAELGQLVILVWNWLGKYGFAGLNIAAGKNALGGFVVTAAVIRGAGANLVL